MRKRDMVILLVLIAVVIAFTAWEKINEREKETQRAELLRIERGELVAKLARYDMYLDSLSTYVLQFIDSLKTEAAMYESLAMQTPLEVADNGEPAKPIARRGAKPAPPDTMPRIIHEEYKRALAGLPKDLTKYEKKIATKEVESAIRAKFRVSESEFAEMKKNWAATGD